MTLILLLVIISGCACDSQNSDSTEVIDETVSLAQPDVIRTVYEPETGLVAPPSVVLKVETLGQYHSLQEEQPPQAAWFVVDAVGENVILDDNRVSLAEVFSVCYGRIIPIFELETVDAAQIFQSFSKISRTTDFLVVSDNPDALKEINLMGVRKALITGERGFKCAQQVHEAGADIAVLTDASREEAEYLQIRFISVMLYPNTDAAAAGLSALGCGANHVVVSDHKPVYALYKQVTEPKIFVRRAFLAAHRGLPTEAPENSVEGFLESVKAGADAVECDVFLTVDGHLVVHHDDTLNLSTVEKANVSVESLTREELKQYTLNPVGNYSKSKIAFLDEFFILMQDNSVHLIIEIKTQNPQCVAKIRVLAEEYGMLDRISIISFYPEQVAKSREVIPEVGASLIVNVGQNSADKLLRSAYIQTTDVNGAYSPSCGFSSEGVRSMQHRGMLVNLWTVDGVDDMIAAAEKGITMLTTNTITEPFFLDLLIDPSDLALIEPS